MNDLCALMGELVQRVTRMFYEPHHIVIMDIMLHHLVLDEEDLADKMMLLPREFNKIIVRLRDDKLLSSETISDLKEDGKQVTKTKFFLDFRVIRDVVKYKIYTMTQRLERRLRLSESTLGFSCPKCQAAYSLLDAQSFLSTEDYTFRCPDCSISLVEKKEKEAEEKESASNLFSLMMEEIAPLISQLKKIDQIGIPEMLRGKIILSQGGAQHPAQPLMETPRRGPAEEPPETAAEGGGPREEEIVSVPRPGEDIYTLENNNESSIKKASGEIVSVQGEKKPYEDVTESDKERMDEEEYERYFELFEKYGEV